MKGTYACAGWGCSRGIADKKAAESKPSQEVSPATEKSEKSARDRSRTPPPEQRVESVVKQDSDAKEMDCSEGASPETVADIDRLIKEEKEIIAANRGLSSSRAQSIIELAQQRIDGAGHPSDQQQRGK